MMKLTASMLIIAGLLCSCVTRSAVIGQLKPSGIHHQSARQSDRNLNHIVKRSTHHATMLPGKSIASSHSSPASAQTVSAQAAIVSAQPRPIGHDERTIDAFVVTGNTRMSTAKIQSALKQYRGQHKTGADVSNAMRSVIDLYSASGLNGAIITKKDHVVVLHVIEDSINAGTEAGLNAGGRHYSTAIQASPMATATAQSAPMHSDIQSTTPLVHPTARTTATEGAHFIIKGNHRVSTAEIQQVLRPYAGKRFTRNELFMARLSLMDLYESKGLHNVAIGLPAVLNHPVTLTIYENDIVQAAIATTVRRKATARPSSEWVRLGWQEMGQGNLDQAMDIWQQGVNRMAADRLLAYIGVYVQTSAAIRRIKQIGLMQSAIMLKTDFHGKSAYYVMSVMHVPVDKTLRRKRLAGLRRAMGQHGNIHASSAGKFQTAPDKPY